MTKISPDGEVLRNCQFGTSSYEFGRGITVCADNTIYTVASYYETSNSVLAVISSTDELVNQKVFTNINLLDVIVTAENRICLSGFGSGSSLMLEIDPELEINWKKLSKAIVSPEKKK